MTNLGLELRELGPSEWDTLRSVRLRALLDSPSAFASTYRRELAWHEHHWRRWFEGARWLVVEDRGTPIGIAGVVEGRTPDDDRHHVESIWVAPTHRRHGVFRTLLDQAVEIARAANQDRLYLWVIGENRVARIAYTSAGFTRTGERQLLADGERYEYRWHRDVPP